MTVQEASAKLGKHPETIRRWIRDGKLKADISSKKEGYNIKPKYLKEFERKKVNNRTIYMNRLAEISRIRDALDREEMFIMSVLKEEY